MDPTFGPTDPEDDIKRRLRAQMMGSVGPQPTSVSDQVFQSLNRARDELAQRIQGLQQPVQPRFRPEDALQNVNPPPVQDGRYTLSEMGDATANHEPPSPSFGQRLLGILQSPRLANAVEGFSSTLQPGTQSGDSFVGSAARAFTGARQAQAQAAQLGLARQEHQEDRALAHKNIESEIAHRQNGGNASAPKFGVSRWVVDPDDPTQELSLSKDPTTGRVIQDTFPDGRPMTRPVQTATRNIDPNSPQGIAAAVDRARKVATAVSQTTPNAAIATTRAFAERSAEAMPLIDNIVVPDNLEYEAGRRSPVEAGRSQTYRQWRTKALQFIYPILRKETGAAISNQEFEDAVDMYIPKPGDGPDVLAQKRSNRAAAVRSLRSMGNQGADDYTPPPE